MLLSWQKKPRILVPPALVTSRNLGGWEQPAALLGSGRGQHGTFVGRIAQDLGLELAELVPRLFRVASKDRGDLLEVFHVEVEVRDINDNPPVFPENNKSIVVAESRPPETRFPLDGASDADIGVNSP
ncbi:hypothetical protein U0070_027248 [Myodes glareolus]|uniref:Cadherin N-terminal domain-containing protein n=1 Tax=Myodes glareolus TaxID=447135 RepID=A0AAW0HJ19_MYOGA